MDAKVRPVGAEFFRRDGEVDRLQRRVGGRPRLRLRRRGPMAEGEEADVFHGGVGAEAVGCRSPNLKNLRSNRLYCEPKV